MSKKKALLAAVFLVLLWQGPALAAQTAAGQFSLTKTMQGIPGRAAGTITFTVSPQEGTFTCRLSGSGKLTGNTTSYNTPVHITAAISLASSSCAGRYHAEQGTIDGAISIVGSYTSTATYASTQGGTASESDSGSETQSGSIYGSLTPGGGGEISTGDGTFSWQVTRAIARAVEQTAQPELTPPEQTAPEPEPEPEQTAPRAEGDEVVSEYIKDSCELTDSLMSEYKSYKSQGGRLGFSAYLRRQYPDGAEREQVETAIRVAAEEKEKRERAIEVYSQSAHQTAGEVTGRYYQEAVIPAANGQGEAVSFHDFMARTIADPAERARLEQAAIYSAVDAYHAARDGYGKLVESRMETQTQAEKIWKSSPAAAEDTRENWLRQKAWEAAQGQMYERTKAMLPEEFVEKAEGYYEKFSGWKENFDQAVEIKNTVEGLQERNRALMDKYREGKLDAAGVQALRGLNVLQAAVESAAVPDFGGYKEVWKEGMGKAVKFSNDFVVYKTSARSLSPDMSDKTITAYEDSYRELRKFGRAETHKPYNDKNLFIEFFQSINPWAKRESPPEKKKYY